MHSNRQFGIKDSYRIVSVLTNDKPESCLNDKLYWNFCLIIIYCGDSHICIRNHSYIMPNAIAEGEGRGCKKCGGGGDQPTYVLNWRPGDASKIHTQTQQQKDRFGWAVWWNRRTT